MKTVFCLVNYIILRLIGHSTQETFLDPICKDFREFFLLVVSILVSRENLVLFLDTVFDYFVNFSLALFLYELPSLASSENITLSLFLFLWFLSLLGSLLLVLLPPTPLHTSLHILWLFIASLGVLFWIWSYMVFVSSSVLLYCL